MHVRRRDPCFVHIADTLVPDFAALLRGTARLEANPGASLLCPLTGERIPLDAAELQLLARLPAHGWQPAAALAASAGVEPDAIVALARRRVLVCDADETWARAVREGEERLRAIGWHPLAALYHAGSRWTGVAGDEGSRDHADDAHRERLTAAVDRYGPLPAHFHRRDDALSSHALPREPFADPFAQLLRARRTTRHFDRASVLSQADLGRVLRGAFGAMATQELAPGAVALRRTSASGGALHPVEAYPLLIRVEGMTPGFYHYAGDRHALSLLQPLDEAQARAEAAALTIGQTYFAEAHALVFHVGRIDRHHWKYRRHAKAYKALLLDSGHLSQTFYLLAAERGLGAFYTAAINDGDVGARLRLDPLREIAIGASGLGLADPERHELHLHPVPHEP